MPFKLRTTVETDIDDLRERFFPFLMAECHLPFCEFHLFGKAEGAATFADSSFSVFLEKKSSYTFSVGDYMLDCCGDGIVLSNPNCGSVWVHDRYQKIEAVLSLKTVHSPILQQLIMRAYQYTLLFAGGLLIHAAAVMTDGEGILFCGIPGAGKSTQARLWEQVYGAEALNNDQPAILWDGDRAMVHGTPWSGKEPCYKNEQVPIRAIVFVEKAPFEQVERLRPAEAFGLLHLNNMVIPVREGIAERYDAVIERVVTAVPVYRQYCTKTENAPKALHQVLFG